MVWMSKTHLPLTVKDNLRKGLLKLLIPTFLEQQPLFYQPHPFYGKILTPFLGKLWKLNLLHLQKGWGPTIDMMWVKVNNNSAFVVVVVVVSEQLFVSRKEMLNVCASFCWNKIFNCPEVWLLKSVSEQQTFLNTADLLQPPCFVAVSHQFIGISGFMGTTLHKKWSFPLRISSVNVRKKSDVSLDRWFLHNILLGQFFGQQWYKRSTSTFSKSDIRDKGYIFIISATAASDELFYSFKYFYVSIAYVKSYSNIDSVIDFS